MPRTSPSFERPPLAETALGVQYDPLPGLNLSHLVALLQQRGLHARDMQEIRATGQTFEPTNKAELWVPSVLQPPLSGSASVRILGLQDRDDGARLTQVENGWLAHNWQARRERPTYPRYAAVRPEFDSWIQALSDYVERQALGSIRPNLWEVVYINVIPAGPLWSDVGQWADVLPGLLSRPKSVRCGSLQTAGGRWVFALASHAGRLQVTVEHARRTEPREEELLVLRFVARGPVDGSTASLDAGLGAGHAAIVESFVDIASDGALDHWGYRR